MNFNQMVRMLRAENKGKIVLINAGIFYIAVEEDAVLLNSKLKLKCSCFKDEICKVGVPIKVIDKYLEKIENLGYSYIVYNFDKEKGIITKIKEFAGKPNKTIKKNINCLMCKGIKESPDDIYLLALRRHLQQQISDNNGKKL